MSLYKRFAADTPAIATRAELRLLQREHANAHASPQPTPRGPEAASIKDGAAVARVQRIAHLDNRLTRVSEIARPVHRLATMKGTTKRDFDRGR